MSEYSYNDRENDNHPLSQDEKPYWEPHMPINPNVSMNWEGYGDCCETLRQLAESGEPDCPWLTWDECISDTIRQILGFRLQVFCNNRRIRGNIND